MPFFAKQAVALKKPLKRLAFWKKSRIQEEISIPRFRPLVKEMAVLVIK